MSRANREPNAWEVLAEYLSRPSLLLIALSVTTLVLYSGSLFFGFVWDDIPQIVNCPILRSWSNLPRAFNSDLWYHVARHQVYYRPLFVAWSMLNYALFGLRPWGWHLGAIALHAGAVSAVFWLARRLGLDYWTAALAALLFAIHPIHIEPAVWISAASDSMVAMFMALAFIAFLNGRDPENRIRQSWWIASLTLLGCALLTKEMAVTFCALVGLYSWLHPAVGRTSPGRRVFGAVLESAPYAVTTAAYALLRKHALTHATGQFDSVHGLADMFRTLPMVLSLYLRQLLLPVGMTGLYYTPYVMTISFFRVLAPLLALFCVATGLWYWNRKEGNSTVAFAGLWLLVALAPALYLRNFGNGDFVRDRYVYLPSVGFAILSALALRRLPSFGKWNATAVQGCVVLAVCVGYTVASLAQQMYWGSELLIWTRGQQLYPGNPYAEVGLSEEYSARGANEKAIELAKDAVRDHPEYGYGPLALAEAYIRAGQIGAGRQALERFLATNPDYAKTETGIATLAGLYGRMGDYDHALGLCDEILAKEPDLYSAIYNCGNIHLMAGQYAQAEQLLARAVQMDPGQSAPKHFLGRTLFAEGRDREAEAYLEAAAAMDPSVWDYHYWLGESLERAGNKTAARAEYERALNLNQDSAEVKLRLATLEEK